MTRIIANSEEPLKWRCLYSYGRRKENNWCTPGTLPGPFLKPGPLITMYRQIRSENQLLTPIQVSACKKTGKAQSLLYHLHTHDNLEEKCMNY